MTKYWYRVRLEALVLRRHSIAIMLEMKLFSSEEFSTETPRMSDNIVAAYHEMSPSYWRRASDQVMK